MSFRKTVVALALASAAVPAAFASSGSIFVGGELGFDAHAMPGNASRADVKRELEALRNNRETLEGGSLIGGEVGYISPQHSYASQNGRFVHTDNMPHNTPKPPFKMTSEERRSFQQQFIN
ncbi:MAG: DUF4148 domain-containing protein [Pseudomonadota bacterium]